MLFWLTWFWFHVFFQRFKILISCVYQFMNQNKFKHLKKKALINTILLNDKLSLNQSAGVGAVKYTDCISAVVYNRGLRDIYYLSLPFLSCYIIKSFKIFIKKNDLVIIIQRCHEANDSCIHWRDVTFHRAGLGIIATATVQLPTPNECPGYDTDQSEGEVLVILELSRKPLKFI